MNYLLSLAILLFGAALIILVFKLLKGLVKTAVTALIILIVLTGASFAALYQDYKTVQAGLAENAAVQFTHDNQTITTVNVTSGSAAEIIPDNATTQITFRTSYEAYNEDSFTHRGDTVSSDTAEEILSAAKLSEIGDALRLRGDERIQLRQTYSSAGDFKHNFVSLAIQSQLEENPNRFLLNGFRDGTITVEPPLLTTRFINIVPGSIIDQAWNQVN